MTTKEETRARLEALKQDQQTLKRELAALDTFMEKKARRRPKEEPLPPARPPERYEAPRYDQPSQRDYGYREPPRYRDDDIYEMMGRNLGESRKMMDKFDYLLDTLIQSMEEVEGENIDDLVKALAQSQMHVMDVLAGIKSSMDKANEEASTKKELEEFERGQTEQYRELNKKVNSMMEQMQHPPYLQELDQIRVQVSNLASELHRLQEEGIKVGGVSDDFKESVQSLRSQTEGLTEKINGVYGSLENISEHVNQVQATTSQVAGLKQHLDKMRDMLSAKDDAILNDTHLKISQLDSRMAELNETISKFQSLDQKISGMDSSGILEISHELQELKKSLPETSLKKMQEQLSRMEETLNTELKKKQNLGRDREILLRLIKKTGEMEGDISKLEEAGHSGAAAETFSRLALENKLEALEKLVGSSPHYEELKQLQDEHSPLRKQLKKLKRQVRAAEVIGTFSRIKDKSDNMGEVKNLEKRMSELKGSIDGRISDFETALQTAGESRERESAMGALEELKARMEKEEQELEKVKAAVPPSEEMRGALEGQRKRLAEIEGEFDQKTKTLEREMLGNRDFFEKDRREREKLITNQLAALRSEIVKAREEAKEVPANLSETINKIHAEMERMKRETPEELRSLAARINSINSVMDEIQKEMRYGEASEEKIADLSRQVDSVHSQIGALSEEALRSQQLLSRIDAMERALEQAKEMQGNELEGAIAAIKSEMQSLEGEVSEVKEGESDLSAEVSGVHKAIAGLEKKTRDEINSRIHDLKSEVAAAGDVESIKKSLTALEKRVQREEGMEAIHDRVILAKDAAEKGNMAQTKIIVKGINVPSHPTAGKVRPEELDRIFLELKNADKDYEHFLEKVMELKKKYEERGNSQALAEELGYLEEDLLDFWIDKRGISEALSQAKKGNLEDAKQLLEYERGVLEDLKLDINSLRMKAGSLPKEAVKLAESALSRREEAEEELSGYDALQESLDKMRRERTLLKKELEAVKEKTVKTIVPEKIQSSLELAKTRPTPSIGREVERLERDLREKRIVPITEKNLSKAHKKMGELAGKAKQIEFGTGDPRLSVAKEKLERSRERLTAISGSSDSIKNMAVTEELNRLKPSGRVALSELAHNTGIGEDEIRRILPGISGRYRVSGGFVEKP